ncbi:MAG: hypothetical protein PG978_000995 [Wolbachia endosymbiont of Ctenocephalides felis wCfeF]|nr:MAG: hypothetical protein PG978_000995 [Wolbachia endosymbiont of Ctenocephalides felis wCfeF]
MSIEDSKWITLPKSALFGENLNLKRYYNQKLSLSKGEKFLSGAIGEYYIPEVMYGQIKICELAPFSFPSCGNGDAKMESSSKPKFTVKDYKIVVEKNDAGELSIYLAKRDGTRVDRVNYGEDNFVDYLNSSLKTVLLENSNIREILPELEIDDSVNLDKRKLNCLISKMHNVDLAQVAQELVTNKKDELGRAVLEVKDGDQEILVTKVADNSGLRTAVATNLKGDQSFKDSVKGEPGTNGISPGVGEVATELVTNKKDALGKAVLEAKNGDEEILVTKVAGNLDLRTAVATNLKGDQSFKDSVKGEDGAPGPTGPSGPAGQDGKSPSAAVATQLFTGEKKDTLVTEVASDEGLREAIAGNQVLKDAVTTALNGDDGFHSIAKRSTNADNAKQKFTLQKGEKLLDDVHEANVVLNGKTMATLPKIGYYMLNDQLVVRNHVTKEKVVIPEDFHFLKVIKFGSGFSSGDYKLTFCNVLGNEFFEYKKYDPQYSNVSDEYKFISLNCAKKEYNPNLSKLFSHRPSFFITEGPDEPGSPGHYQADVFELTNNNKGRKMATLIDKFCYFNENDQFKCCNYHKGIECRIYDTSEINQEYRITDANSKFSLTDYDDVILHTIPELI